MNPAKAHLYSDLPPSKQRRYPCVSAQCRTGLQAVRRGGHCTRACSMRTARARQTPEQRRQAAIKARQAQDEDNLQRMVARVMVLADTWPARIRLAYRFGQLMAYRASYKARQVA